LSCQPASRSAAQLYLAQLPLSQEEDQCEVGKPAINTSGRMLSIPDHVSIPLIPVACPEKQAKITGSEKLVKSNPQLRDKSITNVEGRTQKEELKG
jgi:hypothetical protein